MDWYDGPPLLRYLEEVDVAADRHEHAHARLPVQYVVRPHDDAHHDYRGYAGRVAGGTLRVGEDVVVLPSGARSQVAGIDTFDGPLDEAGPAMSVTVRLADDLDVSRGQVIASPTAPPAVVRELVADVCWFDDRPLQAGGRYILKAATRTTRATVADLVHAIDVDTLGRDASATSLELNDIGRLRLRTAEPVALDPYAENRSTGAFILIDEHTNATVAAGMVVEPVSSVGTDAGPRSENVVRHIAAVTREQRWAALGRRGGTVWLTGLPSSGKSTIASALEALLIGRGRAAYVLDGDTLRHGLTGDLGFSAEDRAESVRRAGEAAVLVADAGTLSIVSLVSPNIEARDAVRRRHEAEALPFLEIHVDTPVEECERRDPKGLYAKARAGEIKGFTGIDDPYEAPVGPELRIDGTAPLEDAVAALERALDDHDLL
jgi:bifunctional enzyme CysN/CysC